MGETWDSKIDISDQEYKYNVRTHTYGENIWIFKIAITAQEKRLVGSIISY